MHELSIAQALSRAVIRQMQERGIAHISRIVIRVGPWSGVMAEALRFHYELIRAGTLLESVDLVIEESPLTALCQACGGRYTLDLLTTRCPDCGSERLTLQGGEDLEILRLEIDPPSPP
ncbi:MAG TPA: hydrogenase maturation nickel metallochaperone HypA [bacterium]|nr:hydrogenase maturation nickel metallochaperone HypA [bacterium]HQI47189.1 hydrogenase maturation nickel metallochaperone HypA [bacterium]HQJ63512.1 hydrogenase maturation nickel metallochaperone HypA [bacterium]